MGWIWFVPTFHMPQPPPASPASTSETKTTFVLTRKEVDFLIGLGQGFVDVAITLEWVTPADTDAGQEAPPRAPTGESLDADLGGGVAAAVQAVVAGGDSESVEVGGSAVREALEVKQGAEG